MKQGWFIVLAGLVGSLAGVLTFVLTRLVLANLLLRLAAGGLVTIMVPILVVVLFYRRLVVKPPEE